MLQERLDREFNPGLYSRYLTGGRLTGGDCVDNRKNSSLAAILEYPFDFDRYIEEQLREIKDLDERYFAKKVMVEGLGKLIRCTEDKYRQLEQRVYAEMKVADNQYEAVMTVVEKKHYDPTNGTLYPVDERDLEGKKLSESRSEGNRIWMGTIFLETDDRRRKAFERAGSFSGALQVQGESRELTFQVHPAKRYRDVMERLYQVFQDNHIPWETVNTAYLDKFYDVYAGRDELGETSDTGTFLLEQAAIDFGEFADAVLYDRIPLWNMKWVKFSSTDFMVPCIDGIYYEHEFNLSEYAREDGYLIERNEDILEIRHEKQKIVIKSQKATFEDWKALHIIRQETIRSLDYGFPLLTNHKRDSFIRRFTENSRVQLTTKADLFRRIMEMDIRDYIEVVDYEICENTKEYPNAEGMNWFVRDELFPMESRKALVLKFDEKRPGYYLNDSMIRFVISQIQLEISEYRCVGVWV